MSAQLSHPRVSCGPTITYKRLAQPTVQHSTQIPQVTQPVKTLTTIPLSHSTPTQPSKTPIPLSVLLPMQQQNLTQKDIQSFHSVIADEHSVVRDYAWNAVLGSTLGQKIAPVLYGKRQLGDDELIKLLVHTSHYEKTLSEKLMSNVKKENARLMAENDRLIRENAKEKAFADYQINTLTLHLKQSTTVALAEKRKRLEGEAGEGGEGGGGGRGEKRLRHACLSK